MTWSRTQVTTVRVKQRVQVGMALTGTGVGVSDAISTKDAVDECIRAVSQSWGVGVAGENSSSVAILTSTCDRDVDELVQYTKERLPSGVPIHGLTTCANVLTTTRGAVPGGVGLMLLSGPQGAFETVALPMNETQPARAVAKEAAQILRTKLAGRNPGAILMASHPGDEEQMISGIEDVFGQVPVYGGTAADNTVEGNWTILSDSGVFSKGISLLAIVDGAVRCGGAIVGPYVKSNLSATITKSEGRRIMELDNRPAADVIREWMGSDLEEKYTTGGMVLGETSTKPVAVSPSEASPDAMVSIHIAVINKPDRSIDLFREVSNGQRLHYMMQKGTTAVMSAEIGLVESFEQAKQVASITSPSAGLIIYCGGMGIAVGDGLSKSLTGQFAEIASPTPLLGMTCFGEQTFSPALGNHHRNLSVGVILFE